MAGKDSHFISWDRHRDLAHPGTTVKTLTFAVEHLVSCAKEAIQLRGRFTLALSGGSTPQKIYSLLTTPPLVREMPWDKLFLFWGDERNVPLDHTESNYQQAMEAGFKIAPLLPDQVFPLLTQSASSLEEAAQVYEHTLAQILHGEPLDFVMLGVGKDDGHTASLFSSSASLLTTKRLVIPTVHPETGQERLTLTYFALNQARNSVFYVLGQDKSAIIKKLFCSQHASNFPAYQVGSPSNKALWIIDSAAGSALFNDQPPHNR